MMKKTRLIWGLSIFTVSLLTMFYSIDVLQFISSGVLINPQRNTGPDFLVVEENDLVWKQALRKAGFDESIRGLYIDSVLDESNGPIRDNYLLIGEISIFENLANHW